MGKDARRVGEGFYSLARRGDSAESWRNRKREPRFSQLRLTRTPGWSPMSQLYQGGEKNTPSVVRLGPEPVLSILGSRTKLKFWAFLYEHDNTTNTTHL
jgi:hypothetical protein